MKSFLYVFGYWTPEQRRQNEQRGWDDEDSAAVVIAADSEEEALGWGRRIAEEFVRRLYGDDPSVSWSASGFADRIENCAALAAGDLSGTPHVNYGEYPNWDRFPRA